MNKRILLGLLSLIPLGFLSANEYVSEAYFEEMTSQPEIIYELNDLEPLVEGDALLPIAQRIPLEGIEPIENEFISNPRIDNEMLLQKEVVFVAPPLPEEDSFENSDYGKALERAKREGKIIMLSIRSTHCKYCDKMEMTTLRDESVLTALNNDFITLYYNQDLETLPLGLQSGVTPIFVFVNTDEDILNQYPGVRNPEEFKEALREILAK